MEKKQKTNNNNNNNNNNNQTQAHLTMHYKNTYTRMV